MPRRRPGAEVPRELRRTNTGRAIIDSLSVERAPRIDDYVLAASDYVQHAAELTAGQSKQAQIALSAILARVLREDLTSRLPRMKPYAGELAVAGALRTARADVSETHPLDGLRLAVELKPINLAVGRAIWNRFGDIRAFAVNIHLKFPFAVVGGVLTVPTWEWSRLAERQPQQDGTAAGGGDVDVDELARPVGDFSKRSTGSLIDRLLRRLSHTRARETEADAAHLLEAVAVVVYDPDHGLMHPNLPAPGSGFRWNEFVDRLVELYDVRFEDDGH